nr:hypothetical protein [Herminiimonas sp. CN]
MRSMCKMALISCLRQRQISGKSKAQNAHEKPESYDEATGIRRRNIGLRQHENEFAVLHGGDQHRQGASDDKENAKSARESGMRVQPGGGLQRYQLQEQAEPGDHEAKPHDGKPGPDPRQKRAFSGKENPGI